jgi:hypothetical protein
MMAVGKESRRQVGHDTPSTEYDKLKQTRSLACDVRETGRREGYDGSGR